jgi:hypothetical protein
MVAGHIVWIDALSTVDIEAASADTIYIHNGNSNLARTATGNVTLIW